MSYTLKVEWTGLIVRDVHTALAAGLAPRSVRRPARDLDTYRRLGDRELATINVNWTDDEIFGVLAALARRSHVLAQLMLRARDNDPEVPSYHVLVAEQTRVGVAARDIRNYREVVERAKRGGR